MGRVWSEADIQILRDNRRLKHEEMMELLPRRTYAAIQSKRNQLGLSKRALQWMSGEDDELRVCALRAGPTEVQRRLPHRTIWEITERAKVLRVSWYIPLISSIGDPLVDAIRARCVEDNLSIRGLDREIGGGYFSNVAAMRKRQGLPQDMRKIRQAIAFFDATLVTDPHGVTTIDWQDE